jgi:hypothetical protein
MSDLLLIVGAADADARLVDEVARRRPQRVTVLVRDGNDDWPDDQSDAGEAVRDRLAGLLSTIEQRTGATVVGLAGGEGQLHGWRFDRVVDAAPLLAA